MVVKCSKCGFTMIYSLQAVGFSCSLSHKKRKPIRSAAAPFWHPRHQKTDGVPCNGSNGTGCPLLQTCSELAVRGAGGLATICHNGRAR